MPVTAGFMPTDRADVESRRHGCSSCGADIDRVRNLEFGVALMRVLSLDLSSVSANLERKLGWSASVCDTVQLEYRRFLILVLCNQDKMIVPGGSQDHIDQFWHMHILDTRKYARDCTLLEHFIHHNPNPHAGRKVGLDELTKIYKTEYEQTLSLYLQTFGEEPRSDLWT